MLEVRVFLGFLVGVGIGSGAVIPHVTRVVIIGHEPVAPVDAVCEICRFVHHVNKVTVEFLQNLCVSARSVLVGKILTT
jgi:hypothetical protein